MKGCKINMKEANGKPGTDEMIIKAFMEEQPRTPESLHTAIGVNKRTIEKRLKVLTKMNVAKKTSEEEWAFSNYNPLEKTVREAMEQLKEEGFNPQSPIIIANKVNQLNPDLIGTTPEEVEPIAWRLSSSLKIAIDSEAIKRELSLTS